MRMMVVMTGKEMMIIETRGNRGESFCRLCFLRDPEMLRLWKAHRGGEQIMKAVKIGQTNMKIILDEILNYVKRSKSLGDWLMIKPPCHLAWYWLLLLLLPTLKLQCICLIVLERSENRICHQNICWSILNTARGERGEFCFEIMLPLFLYQKVSQGWKALWNFHQLQQELFTLWCPQWSGNPFFTQPILQCHNSIIHS